MQSGSTMHSFICPLQKAMLTKGISPLFNWMVQNGRCIFLVPQTEQCSREAGRGLGTPLTSGLKTTLAEKKMLPAMSDAWCGQCKTLLMTVNYLIITSQLDKKKKMNTEALLKQHPNAETDEQTVKIIQDCKVSDVQWNQMSRRR